MFFIYLFIYFQVLQLNCTCWHLVSLFTSTTLSTEEIDLMSVHIQGDVNKQYVTVQKGKC